MSKSGKGSQFERQFAKQLSLWWTNGERDDVFWRSSNSGGRATVRRQGGKSTFMQAGDIAATDPIGLPLLEAITFELKRGYSEVSIADVFDKAPKRKPTMWERFVAQATQSQEDNGSFAWMLVARRDRRVPLVWYPGSLNRALVGVGCSPATINYLYHGKMVCGKPLDHWLKDVDRQDIEEILELEKRKS